MRGGKKDGGKVKKENLHTMKGGEINTNREVQLMDEEYVRETETWKRWGKEMN